MDSIKNETDLILRDFLAVERTKLANQRTLLSMLRTGLYFAIVGLSLMSFKQVEMFKSLTPVFISIGIVVIAIGFYRFRKEAQKITRSYQKENA